METRASWEPQAEFCNLVTEFCAIWALLAAEPYSRHWDQSVCSYQVNGSSMAGRATFESKSIWKCQTFLRYGTPPHVDVDATFQCVCVCVRVCCLDWASAAPFCCPDKYVAKLNMGGHTWGILMQSGECYAALVVDLFHHHNIVQTDQWNSRVALSSSWLMDSTINWGFPHIFCASILCWPPPPPPTR